MSQQYLAITNGEIDNEGRGGDVWGKSTLRPAGVGGSLDKIATLITDEPIAKRESLTVPSPWSNVISFDMVMEKQNRYGQALYENTRNAWRTLITLVALRKRMDWPIELRTIRLSDAKAGELGKNLLKQIPATGVFGATNAEQWESITFIELNGEVIGILTPTSVVCSNIYYNRLTNDEALQWLTNNGVFYQGAAGIRRYFMDAPSENTDEAQYNFNDPVAYINTLSDENKLYLAQWLNTLSQMLNVLQASGRIIAEINDFKQAISNTNNTLSYIVDPTHLTTAKDIVENIQDNQSKDGALLAIAYEKLSNYKIDYDSIYADDGNIKPRYANLFFRTAIPAMHNPFAINIVEENGRTTIAAAVSDGIVMVKEVKVSAALCESGIMDNGGYVNAADFVINGKTGENNNYPERRVAYIQKWLNFVNAQAVRLNAGKLMQDIAQFNAGIVLDNNMQNGVNTLNNSNFVNFGINGGANSVKEIFENTTPSIDLRTPQIINNICLANTTTAVFNENSVGIEIFNFYTNNPGAIAMVKSDGTQVTPLATDSIFCNNILYVSMADTDNEKFKSDWIDRRTCSADWVEDGVKYAVLWPLQDTFINSVDIDSIVGVDAAGNPIISFDWNTRTVRINLQFAGGVGMTTITSKAYNVPNDENTLDARDIPGISIWPYMEFSDNANWCSIYRSEEHTPGVVTDNVTVDLAPNGVLPNQTFNYGIENNYVRIVENRNSIPRYAKIYRNNIPNNYGYILFERPEMSVPMAANPLKIALDFGTSGSTVYYSDGASAGKVAFEEIPSFTPIAHDNDDSAKYHIPGSDGYSQNNNFYPTIIRKSLPVGAALTYPMQYGNVIYKYKDIDDSKITSNLKWAGERNLSKFYLYQLMMQTAVFAKYKGYNNINLYATYPAAYGNEKITNYGNELHTVLQYIRANGFINNGNNIDNIDNLTNVLPGQENFPLATEGVCAAKFLANEVGVHTLVIDIGGGSTDVSLWSNFGNNPIPLMEASVATASRERFIKPLITLFKTSDAFKQRIVEENLILEGRDPAVLPMEVEAGVESLNNLCKGEVDKIERYLEQMLISPIEHNIRDYVVNSLNTDDRDKFIKRVTAGFYSLLFYSIKSGMAQLREAEQEGKNAMGAQFRGTLQIKLAGNGAKMWNWLPNRALIMQKARDILERTGIAFDIGGITVSAANVAKTEAVQGLIEYANAPGGWRNPSSGANRAELSVVAGVKVRLNYKDVAGNDGTIDIDTNENLVDNPILNNMMENPNPQYTPTRCVPLEDKENNFIDEFIGDLWGAAGLIGDTKPQELRMPAVVDMVTTIKNKDWTSPFFPLIAAIVDQIN